MNLDKRIAFRMSSKDDAQIIDSINRKEGKTFSARLMAYLRCAAEAIPPEVWK